MSPPLILDPILNNLPTLSYVKYLSIVVDIPLNVCFCLFCNTFPVQIVPCSPLSLSRGVVIKILKRLNQPVMIIIVVGRSNIFRGSQYFDFCPCDLPFCKIKIMSVPGIIPNNRRYLYYCQIAFSRKNCNHQNMSQQDIQCCRLLS